MTFKNKVKEIVSKEAFANLEKYVELIEEKNKVINLTGFSGDRLWKEGIYESIFLLEEGFGKAIDKEILDIGAGAGFPSVPYIIAHPDNKLTIYEPIAKRTVFLNEVKEELGLNINIKNIRAEETTDIEKFDLITARAVGHTRILVEISHRPAKIGAKFAFIKGPRAEEEVSVSGKIAHQLNVLLTYRSVKTDDKDNYLVEYEKRSETPDKYPREWRYIK